MNKFLEKWIDENFDKIIRHEGRENYIDLISTFSSIKLYNINMYSLGIICDDIDFRSCFSPPYKITIDGVGASIIIYIKKGEWIKPIGYKEWMEDFLYRMENKKILFIGGTKTESSHAENKLKKLKEFNNIIFVDGYRKNTIYKEIILHEKPDICVVGMGMPKQEILIDYLYGIHKNCIYFPCGGWIKQIAGLEKECPIFLSKINLEWLWRSVIYARKNHLYKRVLWPILKIVT